MEGRPRSEERPDDSDDDSKETGKKSKRRAIARGIGAYLERPTANEEADKSWRSRFDRINQRRDARSLLSDLEPVSTTERKDSKVEKEDDEQDDNKADLESLPIAETPTPDYYETWSPQAVEAITAEPTEFVPDISDDQNEHQEQQDESPVYRQKSFSDYTELRPTINTNTGATTLEQVAKDPVETASELESPLVPLEVTEQLPPAEPTELSQEDIQESAEEAEPQITEAESIDAILRRRMENHVEETSQQRGETIVNNTTTNHETHNHNENRNAGLHLLNYALARRRDTRDRKAAQGEIKRVNKRIDNLTKKTELEKQQYIVPTDKEVHTVFERTKVLEKQPVVNKTTEKQEKTIVNVPESLSTKLYNKQEQAKEAPVQTPEQLLRQVVEAVERKDGIQSEAVFESRHEIKDVPMPAATQYGGVDTNQPISWVDAGQVTAQQSYTTDTTVTPEETVANRTTSEYKEVAAIGAWGAIVGAIVFVIFYMLTRS